jgi:hypothetical protein
VPAAADALRAAAVARLFFYIVFREITVMVDVVDWPGDTDASVSGEAESVKAGWQAPHGKAPMKNLGKSILIEYMPRGAGR